jgi:hypothetical protein
VVAAALGDVVDPATLARVEVEIVDGAVVVIVARLEAVGVGGCCVEHNGLSGHPPRGNPRLRTRAIMSPTTVADQDGAVAGAQKKRPTGWPY